MIKFRYTLFNRKYFIIIKMNSLNKQQYLASRALSGIDLVIAGAGTGKTKTLIEKVKNVIKAGIAKPEEILILTFSNKAAGEIKERVRASIGSKADKIVSGTFHSFSLNFLKENKPLISFYDYTNFPEVIDDQKKKNIINSVIRKSLSKFYGMPVDIIYGLMENIHSLNKRIRRKLIQLGVIDDINDLCNKYREFKLSNNLIDFKDMIDLSISILEEHEIIRENTRNRFKYIFVDEFQDTSENNFRLIRLLLNKTGSNLFLVGDDWQSIYGFRGSQIDYLINMKKYFPDARIHKLNINYRSKEEIVKLSNKFIKLNKYRTSKSLKSFNGKGGIINNYCVESFKEEAEIIRQILGNEDLKINGSAAILYRNNRQGDFLTERLNLENLSKNAVNLMTMHSSKGLEFDTVILAGLSDDIIPDTSNNIEEERRLLYVALTRAKEKLYIIHHKTGDGGLSRFAEELGF